jgi:hypothetical protein
MSTQLSENTVKVKLSDLRKHCRDLLEKPEAAALAAADPDAAHAEPREEIREDAA